MEWWGTSRSVFPNFFVSIRSLSFSWLVGMTINGKPKSQWNRIKMSKQRNKYSSQVCGTCRLFSYRTYVLNLHLRTHAGERNNATPKLACRRKWSKCCVNTFAAKNYLRATTFRKKLKSLSSDKSSSRFSFMRVLNAFINNLTVLFQGEHVHTVGVPFFFYPLVHYVIVGSLTFSVLYLLLLYEGTDYFRLCITKLTIYFNSWSKQSDCLAQVKDYGVLMKYHNYG
jgi:hypothetical protein